MRRSTVLSLPLQLVFPSQGNEIGHLCEGLGLLPRMFNSGKLTTFKTTPRSDPVMFIKGSTTFSITAFIMTFRLTTISMIEPSCDAQHE